MKIIRNSKENGRRIDELEGKSIICLFFGYLGHSFKENRSLVDFQTGNEENMHTMLQTQHFLFGNRSLVDFEIGNEDKML